MTATEQLIAKQVSDVFPASVDDLPLGDAARRGLIAPLRCLRVPPAAAINSVPIVGGDFEERALAAALDHQALNQAAASLYRERFGATPGIVYAAGVEHAYNLAQEFRAAGLKAEAVSGRTPPARLAETLAAYERGEINVLINAMLLAEGWNSPRATVCMHLAPTASRRVYQQRIGRIMRIHPTEGSGRRRRLRAEGATHSERVVSLHASARLRLLPRGRPRDACAATAPATARTAEALARPVARPGDAGRRTTAERHPARVAADRPEVPRRRRAALLGDDRGSSNPLRPACRVREEVRRRPRREGRTRAVPGDVRGGEPEPPPPHDGADGPRGDSHRSRRLRRPRDPRDAGAAVGEGSCGRREDPPARDRRRRSRRRPTRSSRAGRGGSPARRGRSRIGASRRSSPRRSACSAPRPTLAATATRRTSTDSFRSPRRCRYRSEPRSWHRQTATRLARTPRSITRARSSAPSARSPTLSRTTCRHRSSPPGSRGDGGGSGRAPPPSGAPVAEATETETSTDVVPLEIVDRAEEPAVAESSEDAA